MVKSKEQILTTLKSLKNELKVEYKVNKIGFFGSYVSNSQKETSDIDILVEFDEDADLIHFISLSRYLEEIFETKVDLISKPALKEDLKPYIIKEVIYA